MGIKALLYLQILSLPFSPYYLCSVIFHLLRNPPTSQCKDWSPLTTDISAYFQSSARSWNPSSQLIWNPSFSSTTSSQIINLDSTLVTPPLDMLLVLTQQWVEALDVRHEIRAVSLDMSCTFDTVWHPALLSKLCLWHPRPTPHMAYRLPPLS